jgi:hypothetical protein
MLSMASGELRGSAMNAFHFDDVCHRVDDRDVGARPQRQMVSGIDMRRVHDARHARIEHDELRSLSQPLFELRGEYRVPIRRARADDYDDIRLHDGRERLRAGRFAERVLQAIARRRVAHARAGVHIVVAKSRTHELLHEEGFLVRAA